MKCPHCAADIGLFSQEMKNLGKTKLCPHCNQGVKFGMHTVRFSLIFFGIAIAAIVMGQSGPMSAGVAGGVAALFSYGLKPN